MTVQSLIHYLNNFNPNAEIEIEIYETISNKLIDASFDVSFSAKKNSFPALTINVEAEKFKS